MIVIMKPERVGKSFSERKDNPTFFQPTKKLLKLLKNFGKVVTQ